MDDTLTKVTFHSISNKLSPIHWNDLEDGGGGGGERKPGQQNTNSKTHTLATNWH
jgi:hypothetical protein